MEAKVFHTRKQCAQVCELSLRTVDSLLQQGILPCTRIGRSVRISHDDIETMIQNLRNGGPGGNGCTH